jgi:prephenate dehydrogenase
VTGDDPARHGLLARAVVLGGAGAVGTLLTRTLRDAGAAVCVVDTADVAEPTDFLRADVTAPGPYLRRELAAADVVVLALPEPVALRSVAVVAAAMRPGALLTETLSVKTHVAAALRATSGVETLGLNPMFAPSLGFTGRAVAAVSDRDGPRTAAFLELLQGAGASVVRVGADEHDRLVAVTQVLTHASVLAFGLALDGMDVDVDSTVAVAPPPYTTLLALLARISGGQPEVYWDVQEANPYAAQARAALGEGLHRLSRIVASGDADAFGVALKAASQRLGAASAPHAELCGELFRGIPGDVFNSR